MDRYWSGDGRVASTYGAPRSPYISDKPLILPAIFFTANRDISTTALAQDASVDWLPTGGLGGMDILQLMAPVARNHDRTNSILDDRIVLVSDNQILRGAVKQRYLGWCGFSDGTGKWRNDKGVVATTGIGDLRPRPVLLPVY